MFSSFPAPGGKVPLWAIFLLTILGDLPDLGAAPIERRQPEHGARDPADNQFGQGIALSSRYLAAGSKEEIERPETLFGNVKVFDARTGRLIRTFYPSDPNGGFGSAIALSGRRILIGASLTDLTARGAAFLYDIPTGRQIAKLTSPNAANFDRMGAAVAMDGNYAVVGCTGDAGLVGAAFVYDVRNGELLHELRADIPGSHFGTSVAVCGRFALIGASDEEGGDDRGSVYLFDLETGEEMEKLNPPDPADFDYFGDQVALSSRFLVVGVPRKDGSAGAVYVWDLRTGVGPIKFSAPPNSGAGRFGSSVAVSGSMALIGYEWGDDYHGSAVLMELPSGNVIDTLSASSGAQFVNYGLHVALCGDRAAVSAEREDVEANDSGGVYVYENLGRPLPVMTIAASGDAAPGVPDTIFRQFRRPALSSTGEYSFEGFLVGPGTAGGGNRGLWSDYFTGFDVVARTRELVPALGDGVFLGNAFQPIQNASPDHLVFSAVLGGRGVNGSNRRAILGDVAGSVMPVLRDGDTIPEFGGAQLQRWLNFKYDEVKASVPVRLRRRVADGVTVANDSGLLTINSGDQVVNSAFREGDAAPGGNDFRQFLPRVARSGDDLIFTTYTTPPGGGRPSLEAFSGLSGNASTVQSLIRQGDEVPGLDPGQTIRTIAGEAGSGLIRAFVRGPGITGRNNEILWHEPTDSVVLQKGQSILANDGIGRAELVVQRILGFWEVEAGGVVALVRFRGPGVNPGNDVALIFGYRGAEWNFRLMVREGDLICGCESTRIRAIQRVGADNAGGNYAVQVSLTGSPRENQALLSKHVGIKERYLPVVLRKGIRFELEAGPSTLRSILFEAIRERTGAMATGGASVVAEEGSVIATLRLDRGERRLVLDQLLSM
ncbi:MAG: hypothetical protein KDN19_00610 [Verrucomicrobiae bacterium]|nr:hypothetical protein [Verrucomicrobiae bacterium]